MQQVQIKNSVLRHKFRQDKTWCKGPLFKGFFWAKKLKNSSWIQSSYSELIGSNVSVISLCFVSMCLVDLNKIIRVRFAKILAVNLCNGLKKLAVSLRNVLEK